MRRVGRNREKNRRMPVGWEPSASGVIYFRPTNAADRAIVIAITGGPLSIRLGATMDEASTTFANLIVAARLREEAAVPGTVAELVERGIREWLPAEVKNPKTRKERKRHLEALGAKFGTRRYARNVFEASRDTTGVYFRAADVQRHIIEGRAHRRVGVNREVRSWELLFQWARAPWGLTEYNPCSGLDPNDETHRKIVPEDQGIFRLYRHLDPPARFMIVLIRYYGRRKVEQLGLETTDAREDGIHLRRGKDADAKPIILKWDARLRKHYARLMRWRAKVLRPFVDAKVRNIERKLPTALLLNRRGRPYTETGFNSARKRAMIRSGLSVFIGEEDRNGKKVKRYKNPFGFHDIRKSRAEDNLTPAQATNVLAHDDPRTTNVKYRVGPIIVDLNDEVNGRRLVRGYAGKGKK